MIMNNIASVEIIKNILVHPNADRLEIAEVFGFQCVVPKGLFQIGEKICFIFPDSVLPTDTWATFYKTKNKTRVKSQKIRGVWSVGIVEKLERLGLSSNLEAGIDVAPQLNIIKYEAPIRHNLNARGNPPFGIFKTDEENHLRVENIRFGEEVYVTLKCDGSSFSAYCKYFNKEWVTGVTSRSLDLKLDSENPWTKGNEKFCVLGKLKDYCIKNQVSLCLRAELVGAGLNDSPPNSHSKLPLDLFFFNLLNLDTLKYEPFEKCLSLCKELDLKTVPILEKTILTPELIKKYSEDIEKIDGKHFEGCVFKLSDGESFKVLSKIYDSLK